MRYIDFESQSHWSVFTARQNHMQLQFKFDCCKGGCATKLQKKIKNCHLHRGQANARQPRHKDAVKNRLETGTQESQDARVLPPTTHCLESRGVTAQEKISRLKAFLETLASTIPIFYCGDVNPKYICQKFRIRNIPEWFALWNVPSFSIFMISPLVRNLCYEQKDASDGENEAKYDCWPESAKSEPKSVVT